MRGCAVVPSSSPALVCSPVLLTLGLNMWLALPTRWREKGNGATLSWTPEPSDMFCSLLLLFSCGEKSILGLAHQSQRGKEMIGPETPWPCLAQTRQSPALCWPTSEPWDQSAYLSQPSAGLYVRTCCCLGFMFQDDSDPIPILITRDTGVFLSYKGWASSPNEAAILQNRWGADFSIVSVKDTRYLQAWLLFIHLGNLQLP